MSGQQFTTQPAPANPPGQGATTFQEVAGALNVPGPQIPNQETINALGEPLSKEELKKRQEELNKET
ncbi:hypothetical protein FRC08_017679 [Ceratobasidium sp. 394]|nr:hypothetical protein FRC08_017679 [Ceratobasidium sp. 394]KAG9078611.1 hypothetical protein FS749_009335 [Ceratobasidium sp. UAMH 11750]